jgi:thymidylate synthase (FAD)
MKVTLMEATAFPDEICGRAAAVCTDSENYASALKHAVESGHTSVLEHAVFTFYVEGISRAALAQLTRHRLASFDVQSQRYVKLDNPELVIPDSILNLKTELRDQAMVCLEDSMKMYQKLLDAGVPAEDARYVTPQAVPTKLVMTMNARELMHFFSLRTCNRAQWEIRQMADEMLKICRKVSPEIFQYAGPGCVTGKCPEKRPCGKPRNAGEWKAGD